MVIKFLRVKITFRERLSEMDRERERHGNVGSQVERKERPEAPKFSVDREATCPLLLRVFCSTSRHSSMSEYSKGENVCYQCEESCVITNLLR